TRKVQTVALGIIDHIRKERYVRELAYRGVDRVMAPGTMHEYTQPWDGMLGAGRMVRWIAVKKI
ncbi:MAG TPA: acyl-CoA reductase, partial [Methanospirillum sp.]|uniref:acyl-CoA reductase n=1 Tax=Methanospirillum sp. TaxID=45200 RepID=UPI002CD4CB08